MSSSINRTNTSTRSVYAEPSGLKKVAMKVWLNWSKVVNKLRYVSEACLDSDEITEELFDDDPNDGTAAKDNGGQNGQVPGVTLCNPNVVNELHSVENDGMMEAEEAISPSKNTPNLEDKLSMDDITSGSNDRSDSGSAGDVTAAAFCGGEQLWKEQNREWLTPAPENATMQGQIRLLKRRQQQDLCNHVLSRDYPIVYRNLVVHNRTLKRPMNLSDLTKVLDYGWNWDRAERSRPPPPELGVRYRSYNG